MDGFVLNSRAAPVVQTKKRSSRDEMDDDAFNGAFKLAMSDAEEYIDGFIAPLRAVATAFYRGEPFGNEEHGRSQIVMTEMRDAVQGIMPSLLRIHVGGENVVEFVPTSAQTIDLADQQTDYVNHVFMYDNPGFLNLYSVFKDALVRKTGIMKWRWSEDVTVTETSFTGLLPEQVVVLKEDQTTEILSIEKGDPQFLPVDAVPGPDGQTPTQAPPPQEIPTFDVRIRRKIPKNRCIIEALPPEEFIISSDARDEDSARLIGHRTHKYVYELVAMGFDQEEVEEYADNGDTFSLNYEAQVRNPAIMSSMMDTTDPAMRPVLYIEAYMRVDKDGDGIAELRKIIAIGADYHILHDEVVEEAPFAVFCPDPEPHMVIGQSIADQTMDLQLIKSNMVRALLDSLAGSIHPRTVVVEGQVNLDDAMNNEQGAIIRAKTVAAVQELVKPFVGQGALPVISYMDQIKAKRTGVSDASQGLDPDVLQSTEKSAVAATISGAQERIEMYARIFAEGPMKRIFRGVAKLLRENQDKPRMMKLRGTWVEVNPKSWEGDLECHPNVALGKGTDQDKMNVLGMIAQKQETIIQQLGPTNPLCDLTKYRATLAQFVTLAGFKDASRYFGQVTPQYLQQLQNKPPPPNPQMMLVQIEQAKATNDFQLKVAKFKQDQLEAALKDQLAREKLRMDTLVALTTIEAQHGRELSTSVLDSLLNHEQQMSQQASDQMTAIHGNLTDMAAQMHGNTLDAATDAHNNVLRAGVAREQAANAPAA